MCGSAGSVCKSVDLLQKGNSYNSSLPADDQSLLVPGILPNAVGGTTIVVPGCCNEVWSMRSEQGRRTAKRSCVFKRWATAGLG